MTKAEIAKKLKLYYIGKKIIVWGLLASMTVLILSVIAISFYTLIKIFAFLPVNIISKIGAASYIAMLIFVFSAVLFPVGKYNLSRYLKPEDISAVLEYINDMKHDADARYDNLIVISRTASEMCKKQVVISINDRTSVTDMHWRALNDYFKRSNIAKIDIENLKKYSQELLSQNKDQRKDDDSLSRILGERPVAYLNNYQDDKKNANPIESQIYTLCTVALFLIIAAKLRVESRY